MIDPMLNFALAGALAFVLLTAAAIKFHKLSRWFRAVDAYRLVTAGWTRIAGLAILGLELACGSLLLVPRTRHIGAPITVALLLIVTGAVTVNLLRGLASIPCGCGGFSADQPLSWPLVARNFVLIAGAILLSLPQVPRELSLLDLTFALAGAVSLVGLYATASQLLSTRSTLASARR
jgi:hypothetical protein